MTNNIVGRWNEIRWNLIFGALFITKSIRLHLGSKHTFSFSKSITSSSHLFTPPPPPPLPEGLPDNPLFSYYIVVLIVLIAMWRVANITNNRGSFNFLILDEDVQSVILRMKPVIRLKPASEKEPHTKLIHTFWFATVWTKGTIFLTPQDDQILINGTVERGMSWYHWLIMCLPFIIVFGVIITSGVLIVAVPCGVLLDYVVGRPRRKQMGNWLCEVVHGTQFQQHINDSN